MARQKLYHHFHSHLRAPAVNVVVEAVLSIRKYQRLVRYVELRKPLAEKGKVFQADELILAAVNDERWRCCGIDVRGRRREQEALADVGGIVRAAAEEIGQRLFAVNDRLVRRIVIGPEKFDGRVHGHDGSDFSVSVALWAT